ncbi:Hypothetical protein MVR_LOCUS203 [uncultured virus]|nr:Hypothetical protein MVR_LOCUS203 [uncultured virus]
MSHTSTTQLLHGQFPTHNIVSHESLQDEIRRYCSCVNPTRWDNAKYLLKLAKIIENEYCNSDLLHEIAAKSTQYDRTKTDEIWSRCQEDLNDFTSSSAIRDWAKQDNPSAYVECIKKDIDLILYNIATEGISDRDVALIFHYRYPFAWASNVRGHVYYKNDQDVWEHDAKGYFMKQTIHHDILRGITHYCTYYQNEIKAEYTRQNYDHVQDIITPRANKIIARDINKHLARADKRNQTYISKAWKYSGVITHLKCMYVVLDTTERINRANTMIDSFIRTNLIITKRVADTINSVELHNVYKRFYNNDITKIVDIDKFKSELERHGIHNKRSHNGAVFRRIRYKTDADIHGGSSDDNDAQVQ